MYYINEGSPQENGNYPETQKGELTHFNELLKKLNLDTCSLDQILILQGSYAVKMADLSQRIKELEEKTTLRTITQTEQEELEGKRHAMKETEELVRLLDKVIKEIK